MTQHEVSRTLVKSPPELWSECSDPTSLARHLGESFGEIRITKLEPETAVAWEGERASGTVRLEPSGWGTKVILIAVAVEEPAAGPVAAVEEPHRDPPQPVAVDEPQPDPVAATASPPHPVAKEPERSTPPPEPVRVGLFARLRGLFSARPPGPGPEPIVLAPVTGEPAVDPDPEPAREPEPAPEVEPEVTRITAPAPPPEPEAVAAPEPAATAAPEPAATAAPEPEAPAPDHEAALTAALDSLGQAHHRPFSRA